MSYNDALNQLLEMGIVREDAEECLARNSNNAERAANYYWNGDLLQARENEKNSKRWDESAFHEDRYGAADAPTIHAPQPSNLKYLVQAADTLLGDPVGAKSRPPSRSRNEFQIHSNDEEDANLQQALRDSLQDSHSRQTAAANTGPQMSGTVGYTGSSHFKPADNNTYHDPSNWAVTISGPSETNAVEIFLDPLPDERKRVQGQPAFLRPSSGSGYLGPLLTILHSIPAARETLLMRDNVLKDYGQHEQWWSGHVIQLPRVVVEGYPDGPESDTGEVITECQRLMAFLSGTDRAYGTAESLGSLPSIFDLDSSGIVPKFFMEFQKYAKNLKEDQDFVTALESKAVRIAPDQDPVEHKFEVFDLTIGTHLIEQNGTLYDALDIMFWDSEGDGAEVFAEYIGDVCTIQIRTEDNSGYRPSGIGIPSELYFDRYKQDFKEVIVKSKKDQAEIESQIEMLDEKERKIRLFSPMTLPPKTNLDMVKVLQTTKKYFEQSAAASELSIDRDVMVTADYSKKCGETAKQLEEIEARIQKKITDLKTQRDELRKRLDQLKSIFTSPENTIEDAPPLTKYILRGVSTDRGVTYLKRKKITPLINLEDEGAEPETKSHYEWWTMKYNTTQLAFSEEQYGSYEVKIVSEEEVLRAAKSDGQGLVLLVYAKEDPDNLEQEDIVLPDPLRQFVNHDNKYFATEIIEAASKPQTFARKRPHDWNADKEPDSNVRSYMDQWNPSATANSSRAATPGDSRRNSFSGDIDHNMDPENLRAIPEPPSPPVRGIGQHNIHFAAGTEGGREGGEGGAEGFKGAYSAKHESMALDLGSKDKGNDSDDEMTYGSQKVAFTEDGTLGIAPVPPPPSSNQSGGAPRARFNLDD